MSDRDQVRVGDKMYIFGGYPTVTLDQPIKVLDHGYVKYIEHMGTDLTPLEAARMSTGNETGVDPEKDDKLREYLWSNHHATPFEMCDLHIEVQAPIFVFRQWHRHRTQCLSGDTVVFFEKPSRLRQGLKTAHVQLTLAELWGRWQPTVRADRPQRQINPYWPRTVVQGMALRCLNEQTGEFETTHITDVIKSDPKVLYRIMTERARVLKLSADHQVLTEYGWRRLREFVDLPTDTNSAWSATARVSVQTTVRSEITGWPIDLTDFTDEVWKAIPGWDDLYQVSSYGRVRRIKGGQGVKGGRIKTGTVGPAGYLVVSLSRVSRTTTYNVHQLVAGAFLGPCPAGQQVRHGDNNRQNPCVSNLLYGSAQDNHDDTVVADRQQRLVRGYEKIVQVEVLPPEETYDLSVEGPWYNFVANGVVVHNSYNEFSGRYSQMPDLFYVPEPERVKGKGKQNKQGSEQGLEAWKIEHYRQTVEDGQLAARNDYIDWNDNLGIANELARINLPLSQYSKMRAKANLRNWFHFLALRLDPHAQEEIRVYAQAIQQIIQKLWPKTWEVFEEYTLYARTFSRTEVLILAAILGETSPPGEAGKVCAGLGVSPEQFAKLFGKIENVCQVTLSRLEEMKE